MDFDEALEVIEQILLPRPLNSIEKFVLRQSWHGQTYSQMAETCGYGSVYIKEIGSQLWHDLSEVLGGRVTKKNLHLVINDYQQNRLDQQQYILKQQSQTTRHTESNFLDSETFPEIEFPEGPLPLNSPLYINRPPIEEVTYSGLVQPGCMIRIRAPRQMGKSSLLNRVIAHAKDQKYEIVYLDLQEADRTIFSSLDKLLRWLCINASRQLHLNPRLEEYWDEEMGSKVSCKLYFEGYLLEQAHSPILLVVSEVNRVFEHPSIAQDFLPMLRFWHEQAKQVEIWQKLRLVLVDSTEVYIPLKLNQSPFNVGLLIRLPPFTLEQVQDLAQRYGLNWARNQEGAQRLAPLVAMVGGHPYLVSVALYHLHRQAMTLEEILQFAPTPAGIYGDHLRNLLALLREDAELTLALRRVVTVEESVQLEAIAAHKLESLGLVQLNGNEAKPSCELYRLYFRQQLAHQLDDTQYQHLDRHTDNIDISNKDELTQLASSQSFDIYLEIHWQQWTRDMLVLSLILCDIDYFKFYKDAHGQLAGDACIRQIANTIYDCTRYQAILVARCRETKFAALLPYTDTSTAIEVAELIREQVKALGLTHDQSKFGGFPSQFVTVSIGVTSTKLAPNSSPVTLIAAAEEALSKAKRAGRDRVMLSQ